MSWVIRLPLANRSLLQKETLIQYSELPFLEGKKLSSPFNSELVLGPKGRVGGFFVSATPTLFCVVVVVYFDSLSRGVSSNRRLVGGEYKHVSISVGALKKGFFDFFSLLFAFLRRGRGKG